MEDSTGNRLDIGGGLWVSAVVEGVVPKDMLLNAVRRHRRYSLCDPLAVDDNLHAGLYAVNRASVNLVLEHEETDESGWRPRFASIWSCPVEMGPNGELSSFSYWVVTDMTSTLFVGRRPLGTIIVGTNEFRTHGHGLFFGGKPRDIAITVNAIACRDILPELTARGESALTD
jgi:hypothetical protein